jgi:long-subunit fatty acid transport protein
MTWFSFSSDLSLYSPLLYTLMTENQGCRKGNQERYQVRCAVSMDFTFPLMIRPSFHWQITKELAFGFDFYWQNYSVYDAMRLKFEQPLELLTVKIEENVEPKSSTDSVTVSGGVQYAPRWAPGLELHLGVVWDQSPYPDSTYSLLSPDADKLGLVVGASYQFRFGLQLSAGYIPLFYQDRIVRDSVLRPRICKPDDKSCQGLVPDADFSMNGDVRNKRVDMFTFQAGWRFGRRW